MFHLKWNSKCMKILSLDSSTLQKKKFCFQQEKCTIFKDFGDEKIENVGKSEFFRLNPSAEQWPWMLRPSFGWKIQMNSFSLAKNQCTLILCVLHTYFVVFSNWLWWVCVCVRFDISSIHMKKVRWHKAIRIFLKTKSKNDRHRK